MTIPPTIRASACIELGDLDRGYHAIDISGKDARLYSFTCPLDVGVILVAIPKYTKGKLALTAKRKHGQPLTSKVEALDAPKENADICWRRRVTSALQWSARSNRRDRMR